MPIDSIDHFRLERSTDGNNWTPLADPVPGGGAARSFIDTDTPMPTFYYRLFGYTVNGLAFFYNNVSITQSTTLPGDCLLQRMFGGKTTVSSSGSATNSMAVDSVGNVVIVGAQNYTVNYGDGDYATLGGQDAFIAKYNDAGAILWSKRFGQVSTDQSYGVVIDSQGFIIVTGTVSTGGAVIDFGFGPVPTNGGSDVFLLKLASNGDVVFFKLFGGTGSDQGRGVAVDANRNIYITGTYGFYGSGINFGGGTLPKFGNDQHVFIAKLNPDGVHDGTSWQRGFGGTSTVLATGISVSSSAVVIAGHFNFTANFGTGNITAGNDTRDVFVGSYSLATGATNWVKKIGDTGGAIPNIDQTAAPSSVAMDSQGNVVVAGNCGRSIDFGSGHIRIFNPQDFAGAIWVVKYTAATGEWMWDWGIEAEHNAPQLAAVRVDSNGEVVFVGEMITGINFGDGWLLGNGGTDIMLVKLTSQGVVKWSRRGGPQNDRGTALAIHPVTRHIYVGGDCGATLEIGANQVILTTGTKNNSFWTRWTP